MAPAGAVTLKAVGRNVLISGFGRVFSVLSTVATAPLVIGRVGVETYGYVSVLAGFQAILNVADLGILALVTSKFTPAADENDLPRIAGLARALDIAFLTAAVVFTIIGFFALLLIPSLPSPTYRLLISAGATSLFPAIYYSGALSALKQFTQLSLLSSGSAIVRLAGIFIVTQFWKSPAAVLAWMGAFTFLYSATARAMVWRSIGQRASATPPDWHAARSLLHFGLSASAAQSTGIAAGNADRLIVAALLPLSAYGIYSVGSAVAMLGPAMCYPIFLVLFPAMTSLRFKGEIRQAQRLYVVVTMVTVAAMVCISMVFFAFTPLILRVLLRLPAAGPDVISLVRIMMVAGLLRGFTMISQSVQMAFEKFRVITLINLVALIVYSISLLCFAPLPLSVAGIANFCAAAAILLCLMVSTIHLLRGEPA